MGSSRVTSARFGRIRFDRKVGLTHPRHGSVKTSPAFTALEAELVEQVRAEVLGTQGG